MSVWTERPTVLPFLDPKTRVAPGVSPLDPADWLRTDETYDDQMALRDRLIAQRRDDVILLEPEGEAAAAELLEMVAAEVVARHGARREGDVIRRRDGAAVDLGAEAPIVSLGRLAQEDFQILAKPEGAAEHVLLGGVLCFPASWTLAEKLGRGLVRVHKPVRGYAETLAPRVQRLFDAVRPGRPLQRANWLFYDHADLFSPKSEAKKMTRTERPGDWAWLRVERQCLTRLPATGAVVFSIRTYVLPLSALDETQRAGLREAIAALEPDERDHKVPPDAMRRLGI